MLPLLSAPAMRAIARRPVTCHARSYRSRTSASSGRRALLGGLFAGVCTSVLAPSIAAQFVVASTYLNQPPRSVHSGDLNGDGRPDVVHANGTSQLEIRVNNGTGAFPTFVTAGNPGAGYLDARVFDADGNGDRDVVAVDNVNSRVDVLLALGSLTYAPALPMVVAAGPVAVVDFDLDGDGDRDLAVISSGVPTLTVFRNLTGFVWSQAQVIPLAIRPSTITAGRIGGSALEDLVVVSQSSSRVYVFENVGGTIAAPVGFGTDLRPWEATVADFDNDGDNDLAVTSTAKNFVDVFSNVTPGPITATTFAPFVQYGANGMLGPAGIDSRDIDCDGFVDLVAACTGSGSLAVFRNQSGAGFAGSNLAIPATPFDLSLDVLGNDNMPEPVVACPNGSTPGGVVMFNFLKCGECWHTILAGVDDTFAVTTQPAIEDSCPGAVLQPMLFNPRQFDGGATVVNSDFGHTFANLPPAIVAARLTVRLRAGQDRPDNDSFHLQADSSGGFLWGRGLPALTGMPWAPFSNATANITLDLANLPGGTNLLPSMNSTGRLDVYLQDDTRIDFARLELVAQGVQCRHDFTATTVSFLAGTNATIQVSGALPNSLLIVGIGTGLGLGPLVSMSGITFGRHCILGPVSYTGLTGTATGNATISLPIPGGPIPPCTFDHVQVLSMQATPANIVFSNTLTVPLYN